MTTPSLDPAGRDERKVQEQEQEKHQQAFRLSRRAALAALASGGALAVTSVSAAAFLTRDDDNSGSGSDDDEDDDDDGGGRGRGRGRGGDDDDNDNEVDDDVVIQGDVPAGSAEVRIIDDDEGGFSPGTITIDPGQSVTWVNARDDEHTATGRTFDTGIIAPGELVTLTFDEPGTFPYACLIHPIMTGVVEVRGAATPGASPETGTPAASPAASGETANVEIINIAFAPAEITVAIGTTVMWTNSDQVQHTASSTDGTFESGIIEPGASATATFDQPGTFAYICAFHPNMQGTVIVTG